MLMRRDMEWSWKVEEKEDEWQSHQSSVAVASELTREPQFFMSTKNLLYACGHDLTLNKSA